MKSPGRTRWLWAVAATAALAAHAEDPAQRRAREELERQLQQLVGSSQPARVRVEFLALDEPNYTLDDATFELDGRALPRPSLEALSGDGTHPVWSGEVSPGRHVLATRLVFTNQTSVVVSEEGGHTWKVSGTNTFEVQAGLEVRVAVTPQRDASQKDIARRLGVRLPATPVMLGQVDDGAMPEPAARKAPPVDAGAPAPPPLVAADVTPAMLEAAPPEAPPRPGPEPVGVRVAAERRGEALRAPTAGVPSPDAGTTPVTQAPPPEETVSPPVAVEAPPTEPALPSAEEAGLPWGLIGLGFFGALALLVVLARRRARPPTLED